MIEILLNFRIVQKLIFELLFSDFELFHVFSKHYNFLFALIELFNFFNNVIF